MVFDVGENVGVSAAFFAFEIWRETVHCFEPVLPTFRILADNVRRLPKCYAYNIGLSACEGEEQITYYPRRSDVEPLCRSGSRQGIHRDQYTVNSGYPRNIVGGRYAERITMPCRLETISSMMRALSIDAVDLLKVDVEHAEFDVLAGIDEQDWTAIRLIVAEVHDIDGRVDLIVSLLHDRHILTAVAHHPNMNTTDINLVHAIHVFAQSLAGTSPTRPQHKRPSRRPRQQCRPPKL